MTSQKQDVHNHHHGHHHHHVSNIKVAFFLNLAFTLIEIIGGIYTNSVAILSDALHDLGDSLSLGLAWYFQKLSIKKSNKVYTYGYKRFSLIGALVNSIILILGTFFILYEAIPRLINPEQADAKGMIILAVLGIIFNGLGVLKLKKGDSINERVISLHLLEDVLGWVAVLIGALCMFFFDLPIIDPILSVLIACFILYNVIKNLKSTFDIILQSSPHNMDTEKINHYLLSHNEIIEAHDIHTWSMDGQYNILTVHLVLDQNYSLDSLNSLKSKIRDGLHELGIEHATLEFETENEKCVFLDC